MIPKVTRIDAPHRAIKIQHSAVIVADGEGQYTVRNDDGAESQHDRDGIEKVMLDLEVSPKFIAEHIAWLDGRGD